MGWVRAARLDELPQTGGLPLTLESREIALFRAPEGVYAVSNRCPHAGALLHDGTLCEGVLECPVHGWKFPLADEARARLILVHELPQYPAEVRGEEVWVELPAPGPRS